MRLASHALGRFRYDGDPGDRYASSPVRKKGLEVKARVTVFLALALVLGIAGSLAAQPIPRVFKRYMKLFDKDRYNHNATVGENLLFGTPVGPALDMDRLFGPEDALDTTQRSGKRYVRQVLDLVGLYQDFLEIGRKVADTMVELFADLPAEPHLETA